MALAIKLSKRSAKSLRYSLFYCHWTKVDNLITGIKIKEFVMRNLRYKATKKFKTRTDILVFFQARSEFPVCLNANPEFRIQC